jgi:hypothetical protein
MEIKIKGKSETSVVQKIKRWKEREREREKALYYPFNTIFFSISTEGINTDCLRLPRE